MIVAGALGNILDSAFYGVMFDRGSVYDEAVGDFTMYFGKAQLQGPGYAAPLMGNVVDMIHFTKTITWGDRTYEIFPPIFNVADSAITLGIVFILLFQRRFFKPEETEQVKTVDTESIPIDVGAGPLETAAD